MSDYRLYVVPSGPLKTNTIVLDCGGDVLVFDPAGAGVIPYLRLSKSVRVFLTHGHWDHIIGIPLLGVDEVFVHQADAPMLTDPLLNMSLKGLGVPITVSVNTTPVEEGLFRWCDGSFRVMHVPGHTPGSVAYIFNDFAIVGDFIFPDGVGRTDMPGGSMQALRGSLRKFLAEIPKDLPLYPGHGDVFTLAQWPKRK